MFGYIKPFKPQLRICEFEGYKAVYCGLCRELSRTYGPFARLTLSYDFAFVVVLGISLVDQGAEISPGRCPFQPFSQAPHLNSCNSLSLASAAAMLMLYYKGVDNLHDGGIMNRIMAGIYLPFLKHGRKKAAGQFPEIDNVLADAMKAQHQVEAAGSTSLDAACEPTAHALGKLFEMLSDIEEEKRILKRLGYFMGRYVYICDAIDDIKKDMKSSDYNPFLAARGPLSDDDILRIEEEIKAPAYLSAAEAGKACQLLELKEFKSVIENIIFLGLAQEIKMLNVGGKTSNDRSI